MNYLHYDFSLSSGDVVEVTLDRQANVRLLDEANYAKYRRGERHHYYGGLAEASPVRIPAPRAGNWHVVIDLGGYGGTVRASAHVLQGAS
jgi:hypothetical protein